MAQDLAEEVLGAAKDGGVQVLVVVPPPHASLGRHVKDGHVKDAAQDEHVKDAAQGVSEGVAEGVPQDVVQDLAFGARPPRAFLASQLATTAAASVFVQLTLR